MTAPHPKKLINIFLSSIHQNAGKTTVSLGLFKVLKDRGMKVGFLKPVGQQVVSMGALSVDKDSFLIGKVFRCGRKIRDMSPVTIGRGYTEKYIFEPHKEKLKQSIERSFRRLSKGNDALIVEGTGHAGVGSVIDFSNADVAHLLGSKVIIVSEGGIGKSIDEIMLNKALFDLHNVEILGVIVNKVIPEKFEKVQKALAKGLEHKGIKLLGVIPLDPILSEPTIDQIRDKMELKVLCGEASMHRRVKHNIVAAMEPQNMIRYLREGTLVLTSGDRVDNILVAVSSHLINQSTRSQISGIILTGGLMPDVKIVELLRKSKIPVLLTELDTYSVAAQIEHQIFKIQKSDKDKIHEATELVKKYVDVDAILKNFKE